MAKFHGRKTAYIDETQPQGVQGLGNPQWHVVYPVGNKTSITDNIKDAAGICMLQLAVPVLVDHLDIA